MPTYVFRNKDTDEVHEEFMSISERTKFLEDHPNFEQVPNGTFAFVDSVRMGRTKPPDGFRDLLKQIKKNNYGSNIKI